MLPLEEPASEPEEEQYSLRCPHHWIIEPANGPLSRGVCQKCWEVREFTNYIERDGWPTENRAVEPGTGS